MTKNKIIARLESACIKLYVTDGRGEAFLLQRDLLKPENGLSKENKDYACSAWKYEIIRAKEVIAHEQAKIDRIQRYIDAITNLES